MKNNNRIDRTSKYRELEFIASVFDNVTIAIKNFSKFCENFIKSEDYKRMELELTNSVAVKKCQHNWEERPVGRYHCSKCGKDYIPGLRQ